MSKFDDAVNEKLLEEGILNRAGEKIKNVGRSIKHPFARAFGIGADNASAALTTNAGYKKQSMLHSILKNSVADLVKLGVLVGDVEEIVASMSVHLDNDKFYNFSDKDQSQLARNLKNLPQNLANSEPTEPTEETFSLKQPVKVTTRNNKTFNGTVTNINDTSSGVKYTVRGPNGSEFAFRPEQLEAL